jgi:hemolysin III
MVRAHFKAMGIEEVANTLTHGFGLVLSVIGFAFLAVLAVLHGDKWHIASVAVYGSSLVILYAASTFYHSTITPDRKSTLQLVDHCCIYLLIAGSYTPFLLIVLRTGIGFAMLALVWSIALFGIVMKIAFRQRFKALGIVLYLALGWLGLLTAQPMYAALGLFPLLLILAGDLSYTAGMIFFGWKRLRHHHAIFHVFVLAGSVFHYVTIAFYVLPQ